jgi:hypothetical protein
MYMCFSGIDYPSAFMVSDKILELFWQGDIFSNLLSHGINLFLLNRNTIFAVGSCFVFSKQGWTNVVNLSLRCEWRMVI